ncbi:MAG: D-alanine--D-alanine ligase [Thermonemataceae bacterium]
MKIGIFFGGKSREREISFAGGRTVFDNLDKQLFEPVPIFVDSLGNFILLEWQYLYKGTIRDFYPPPAQLPSSHFQIYVESLANLSNEEIEPLIAQVGKRIIPAAFKSLFDFAFLALHGPYGEDGTIQGLLAWYNLPYSGCGLLTSAIGISKTSQQALLKELGFQRPTSQVLSKEEWEATPYKGDLLEGLVAKIGLPMVIKAPHQGSSIGISILTEKDNHRFIALVNKAFFTQEVSSKTWQKATEAEKVQQVTQLVDLREGIGLPLVAKTEEIEETLYHPEAVYTFLEKYLASKQGRVTLTRLQGEEEVLIERFIIGKEFSCIVIEEETGVPLALPPTEIVKVKALYDYRMKYLPGMSRKITPIDLPPTQIEAIREACSRLFKAIQGAVYMRIDGFVTPYGEIFLNDPNTTSGMLPSSFFFHQAAEIGLNPSQFLTYIIRSSLKARLYDGKNTYQLQQQLNHLDAALAAKQQAQTQKIKVAVIMGGYSTERHISVESGRNIYEKLASSSKYTPIPIFLTGNDDQHTLHEIPISMLLKDNADDIKEKIDYWQQEEAATHEVLQQIIEEAATTTDKYVTQEVLYQPREVSYEALAARVEVVFIALHGRPGEDGAIQQKLEEVGLPYNGSGIVSSQTTINKYKTNTLLRNHGIAVAQHLLIQKEAWQANRANVLQQIREGFQYPVICKPADDGCSSAVKKISDEATLMAFADLIFRDTAPISIAERDLLQLKSNEVFPQKDYFLLEDFIGRGEAQHFLEITGGLLTHTDTSSDISLEVFEPSETLATGEVLSLEEKFLAGEGQNITPARFAKDLLENQRIAAQVRQTLAQVAKILNIEGYARIDAFVRIFETGEVETIIIEVNSLPGMTPATCIFHQAALNGYTPYDFIDAILSYALVKQPQILT